MFGVFAVSIIIVFVVCLYCLVGIQLCCCADLSQPCMLRHLGGLCHSLTHPYSSHVPSFLQDPGLCCLHWLSLPGGGHDSK